MICCSVSSWLLRRAAFGVVGQALGFALQVLDLVLDGPQFVRPPAGGALAQRFDAAGVGFQGGPRLRLDLLEELRERSPLTSFGDDQFDVDRGDSGCLLGVERRQDGGRQEGGKRTDDEAATGHLVSPPGV